MKLEQRIVIAAQVLWQRQFAADGVIEHAADSRTIDHAGLHGEADDSACELIHNDHHPVGLENE